jgi:hypothetical protein
MSLIYDQEGGRSDGEGLLVLLLESPCIFHQALLTVFLLLINEVFYFKLISTKEKYAFR